MMPEGWDICKLDDLVSIKGGKRLPKGELLTIFRNNHPYIRVTDMYNRYILKESLQYVPENIFPLIKRYIVNENDIILSIVGTIGLVSIIPGDLNNASLTENCVKLRPLDTNLNSRFLYYFLLSPIGQAEIKKGIVGSTQPKLPLYNIQKIKISLPPLNIQSRIASILSSLDDKIELNTQMNKTLETVALAIFKEWFVDFMFPGFSGEMVDGLPKGWEKGKLSDIANIAIGRTPPRNEHKWFSKNPENIKWISIKDMGTSGVYITDTSEYLTPEAKTTFRIPEISENTLILSFKLTVGRISITTEKMLSNEAIAQIRSTFGVEFLYCYLANYRFDSLGSTSSIATAINSRTIKEMPVLIPDHSVVTQFCAMVRPIFDRIRLNSHEVMTVENIRNELLPKLMTGKIRVA